MSTTPVAYNPSRNPIFGSEQIIDLAVGTTEQDYSQEPGGVRWWMSPDQSDGYVIAEKVSSGDQPTAPGINPPGSTVAFWKTDAKTSSDFLALAQFISRRAGTPPSFSTADDAKTWLNANGYWTSYNVNAEGFRYSNFASTTGLVGVGNTSVSSNIYFLTTAGNSQVGNVYRTTAIKYNRNFSAQWSTLIVGGSGADGYCIQWTPTNNTNGSAGGGVGYVSTAINAITFLTYVNNSYNWYKNNVLQVATNVSSGFWRQTLYFWGDYNHSAQTFALYYSTTNSKPGSPNKTFTSFSFDTSSYYMGFGAATGGANDNHELLSWVLTFT